MNIPDLTPAVFIQRAEARTAVNRWLIPLAVCAVAALVPIVLENAKPADRSGQIAQDRVVQARSQLELARAEIGSQTTLLHQRKRELQAVQHLTLRPDWSSVLTLVAQQFDEQLMMTGFELGKASDARIGSTLGPLARDVPSDSVWLVVKGVAEANSGVPGLIMRLETLGLFERVVMTGTQRESVAGGARTTFTLACKVQ